VSEATEQANGLVYAQLIENSVKYHVGKHQLLAGSQLARKAAYMT
jgi:hypothetical protein